MGALGADAPVHLKGFEPLPHRLRTECAAFTPRVQMRAFARLCSQAQLDVFHSFLHKDCARADTNQIVRAQSASWNHVDRPCRDQITIDREDRSEQNPARPGANFISGNSNRDADTSRNSDNQDPAHTSPDQRAVILHAPLISILRLGISMHLVFHMLSSNESPENESYKRRRPPWFP
jgi:hypothetical protein